MRSWEGVVIWLIVAVPVALVTGVVLAGVRRRAARTSVALPDPPTITLTPSEGAATEAER